MWIKIANFLQFSKISCIFATETVSSELAVSVLLIGVTLIKRVSYEVL